MRTGRLSAEQGSDAPQISTEGAFRQLSARNREILRDIINSYITTGRPVSSRQISKHAQHGLSAASIRNIMADLEDLGLIEQPHTSAGRVPTELGYRLYIENLMDKYRLSDHEQRYIQEHLRSAASDVDELMQVATHLLSELSHQVGVVLKPAVGHTVIKSVEFVRISRQRTLCVVISDSGFIDSVVVQNEEEMPRRELVRISNYLSEKFAGQTLIRAREDLLAMMAEDQAQVDSLLSRAIELARRATFLRHGILVDGTTGVLAQPELSDAEQIRRMLDAFDDKARLVSILNRCMVGTGVRVLLGADCELTSRLDFSLVAAPYGIGSQTVGSLGVAGPSRMEYSRVFALVHYLGNSLTQALTTGSGS